jgi:hypothetical protein
VLTNRLPVAGPHDMRRRAGRPWDYWSASLCRGPVVEAAGGLVVRGLPAVPNSTPTVTRPLERFRRVTVSFGC